MAGNITNQMRSISEVAKAVAMGDLSKRVQVDAQGEMLDLKMTVNSMVNQLSMLADEVTRVSLQVGTEGILGVQATVPDVQGIWKVYKVIHHLANSTLIGSTGADRQRKSNGNEYDEPSAQHRRGS